MGLESHSTPVLKWEFHLPDLISSEETLQKSRLLEALVACGTLLSSKPCTTQCGSTSSLEHLDTYRGLSNTRPAPPYAHCADIASV